MPPVTGNLVPSFCDVGTATSAAGFLVVELMYAAGAARIMDGWKDVVAAHC